MASSARISALVALLVSTRGCALINAVPTSETGTSTSIPLHAWVQMVAGGGEVRAIVAAGRPCPIAQVDGRSVPLALRAAPTNPIAGFPDTCQASLPSRARTVTVAGQRLGVPRRDVTRILVIGDTGCRVTEGEAQDCASTWPFARFARQAAAQRPQLIVHVGDYYYRENCPNGTRRCENWPDWKADFFTPASALLQAAPWVFARGNHESCGRAAQGWGRFLDASAAPPACPDAPIPPFTVPLTNLTLEVVDSAGIPDRMTGDEKLRRLAAGLGPATKTPRWVVTHKPPFVHGYTSNFASEDRADDPALPDVVLFLAGHLHLFGAMAFEGDRPAQMIVGGGGTRLMVKAAEADRAASADDSHALIKGRSKVDGVMARHATKAQFGYVILKRATPTDRRWTATLYGEEDRRMATCALDGRSLTCRALPQAETSPLKQR